ncbi:MAG: sigma-70 family RNA polymerase sigma factor [Gemmatimonadaceae bacterium]|nr:sigma-70 family RNA polymerase sigma factor [Gemmatimonadaceae bacterium]
MTDHSPSEIAPDDAALIARWRGGDERAATTLVERHAQAIARFMASLGEREEVDEVVQDTFVRAFGSLDSFRGESTFRTWLLTIARNLLRDRQRGRKRARLHVEIQDDDLVSSSNALEGTVAAETEQRLRAAVDALSPMQRSIFTLRVTEGLSYREIAIAVGSTEGAARVHYHNAMRAIREMIDD